MNKETVHNFNNKYRNFDRCAMNIILRQTGFETKIVIHYIIILYRRRSKTKSLMHYTCYT